ncbi:MAG TPA: hypothetical protein VFG08_07140 [Candidatus Polarisedimenticolia bacterium]|nr:hypothetical protein [Candidatus Polarisedimenticolia bacterium]
MLVASQTIAGERPATKRPALVDRLPDPAGGLLLSGGGFSFPTARREGPELVPSAPSAGLDPRALRRSSPSGFSDLLLERMNREINRLDVRDRDDLSRMTPVWAGDEDSRLEQLRSAHAERILTKAFDKAIETRLELFARTTAGLGEAWNWVENLDRRTISTSSFESSGLQDGLGAAPSLPRITGGIGFKVAAHPRMILHTELFKIRGRIDIPLRNEPVTVTVERELGARAYVTLTSGLSRGDADDWVNLSLRLGF